MKDAGMQPSKLGVELLRLRNRYGWTRDQIAKLAGVSSLTVLRIENPKADGAGRRVTPATIKRMIQQLLDSDEPITIDEATALADAAGISRSAVHKPGNSIEAHDGVIGSITTLEAAQLMQMLMDIAGEYGVDRTRRMLRSLAQANDALREKPPKKK